MERILVQRLRKYKQHCRTRDREQQRLGRPRRRGDYSTAKPLLSAPRSRGRNVCPDDLATVLPISMPRLIPGDADAELGGFCLLLRLSRGKTHGVSLGTSGLRIRRSGTRLHRIPEVRRPRRMRPSTANTCSRPPGEVLKIRTRPLTTMYKPRQGSPSGNRISPGAYGRMPRRAASDEISDLSRAAHLAHALTQSSATARRCRA
jgi:hypothetical protein